MRLIALLFTVFIDSLGFGLVFPLLAPLMMNPETGMLAADVSLPARGLIFGLLISSFCLAQFFSGPTLGALSDRKGRKKILVVTICAACFSYVLAGISVLMGNPILLFLSRILAGVSAGNFAVAQSVVVDTTPPEEKSKNFGLIGMAWGTGFIIGPFIGGKFSDPSLGWSLSTPFWVAAILCVVNLLLVLWKLKESLQTFKQTPLDLFASARQIKRAFQMPGLRVIFAVMFVFSFGWGFFTEFSSLFLLCRFGVGVGEIANFYAYVGVWVALCQGILIRPFLKRFSSQTLLPSSLIALGVLMPLMLVAPSFYGLFFVLPLVVLPEALIQPAATAIVSNLTPPDSQGEMLGIHNSIQWAGIGLAPLFSGSLVALYPFLPITVCSICMFITAGLFFLFYKTQKASA
jgi:DHA1 family tetracycline resistance protein-like MFS transporter